MMMTAEVLMCKFCGCDNMGLTAEVGMSQVYCPECHAMGPRGIGAQEAVNFFMEMKPPQRGTTLTVHLGGRS